MRVALVNALSYPAFTSGATLQVHRIARALKHRGHDVAVFSGARRPGDRALASRTDEADGIPVTSVNTEDYLGFSDPANYDNPGVVEPLKGWLAGFAPGVVHAHSLQGVGATWIDQVADRLPVIVTMHDWWWICARQFLVTEEMSLDAPLADLSGCPCSGGVDFNQERRAWLNRRLERVARILVPSSSMRDSLLIHGFDPDRVAVDPNGIEPLGPPAAGTPVTGNGAPSDGLSIPHLGFVGGWHDLKGLPLLMEARRRLPDSPLPMRITAWGAAESIESRRLPAGVTIEPEYDPKDTARVMGSVDALAVPSLMRESFSIVAREALELGLPVITSDSGGPEEIVEHGENGLVVEGGNPAAWAEALRGWAGDPELRARLKRGAARGAAGVIDPDTQALHLEQVYRAAISSAAPGPIDAPRRPPRLIVASGIEGAPLRYRAWQLAEAHRALGGEASVFHHRDPRVLDAPDNGDLLVFYRVPWSTWTRRCLEAARARGAATVFSVDDLIFDPGLRDRIPAIKTLSPTEGEQWMEGVRRYQQTALACGVVLASTPAIARTAEAQGLNAAIHPNSFGRETALLSQAALWASREERVARGAKGTVRLGYLSGTTTHDADWAMVEPAVARLLDEHQRLELWLVGPLRPGAAFADHPRVRRIGFRPYQELPRLIAELDVILAPLETGLEFSEAKSAVKWLEAAAVGVPVVASPTEPFREAIDDGITGVLAGPGEWHVKVGQLVTNPELRNRIGRAARAEVYRAHGPAADAHGWQRTWPNLVEAGAAAERSLPPADFTERPSRSALEPRPGDAYGDGPLSPAVRTMARLGGSGTTTARVVSVYPRLCRIDIMTSTFGANSPAPAEVALEEAGAVLARGRLSPEEIADDGWTAWHFDPIEAGAKQARSLTISQPSAEPGRGIAIWADAEGRASIRAFSKPTRAELAQVAVGRPASRPATDRRPSQATVLWHKGRHSISSQGWATTTQRVLRYMRRWWRGWAGRPRI